MYILVFSRITALKTVRVSLLALLGLFGDANQFHSFKQSSILRYKATYV